MNEEIISIAQQTARQKRSTAGVRDIGRYQILFSYHTLVAVYDKQKDVVLRVKDEEIKPAKRGGTGTQTTERHVKAFLKNIGAEKEIQAPRFEVEYIGYRYLMNHCKSEAVKQAETEDYEEEFEDLSDEPSLADQLVRDAVDRAKGSSEEEDEEDEPFEVLVPTNKPIVIRFQQD